MPPTPRHNPSPGPAAAPAASVALGMVVLAGLIAGTALLTLVPRTPAPATVPVDCQQWVELQRDAEVRLACLQEVPATLGARAGDAVRCTGPSCRRVAAGMAAAQRLLLGLPLHLNRATAADLSELDGVSPRLAAAIVAHRETHGAFAEVAALRAVRGVGRTTLARLAPHLTVEAS